MIKYKNISGALAIVLLFSGCRKINMEGELPTVSLLTTLSSTDSVYCTSAISSDGGLFVKERGICWGTTHDPTTSDNKIVNGKGVREFVTAFPLPLINDNLYIRAYATNQVGTAYSSEAIVTNSGPVVTTASVSNITNTSAKCGGNIQASDAALIISARGVCWNTAHSPTIAGNKTTDGTSTGTFTSAITGLSAATTYYVRAYATHSKGTVYGNELSFTTSSSGGSLPNLTTTTISSITATSAISGGNITFDGGSAITVRGVCWSTSQDPDVSDNKTIDGSAAGSFSSNISGLTAGTTYYVRAYATNDNGTAYGQQVTFTTTSNTDYTSVVLSLIGSAFYKGDGITIAGWDYDIDFSYKEKNGNTYSYEISSVKLLKNGEFKIRKDHNWTVSYNYLDLTFEGDNSNFVMGSTNENILVLSEKTYRLTFKADWITNTFSLTCTPLSTGQTVTDIDGNVYNTITIGSQTWMAENLRVTKYSDGSVIPLITDNAAWYNAVSPGYCWYSNNEASYKNTYGALYNWYVIEKGNVCPTGWHVPSDNEWTVLMDFLGGVNIAGAKLKETGTVHWNDPNTNATNESGFTALPGGHRTFSGIFEHLRSYGYLWSSTITSVSTSSWNRYIYYAGEEAGKGYSLKYTGASIRCVKD